MEPAQENKPDNTGKVAKKVSITFSEISLARARILKQDILTVSSTDRRK